MLLPMYSTRIMREKKVFGVDFFFLSLSCLIEGYREKRVVNLKFTLLISTTYSVLFYKWSLRSWCTFLSCIFTLILWYVEIERLFYIDPRLKLHNPFHIHTIVSYSILIEATAAPYSSSHLSSTRLLLYLSASSG